MIDSNAVDPAPAGTEYTASAEAPVLVPTLGYVDKFNGGTKESLVGILFREWA